MDAISAMLPRRAGVQSDVLFQSLSGIAEPLQERFLICLEIRPPSLQ